MARPSLRVSAMSVKRGLVLTAVLIFRRARGEGEYERFGFELLLFVEDYRAYCC